MNEKTSDILVLVLSNGDQLLGEVAESGGAYLVTNPIQILTRGDEQTGQMSMGMVPYLPYCDTSAGVAIPTHQAIVAIPNQELLNHYSQRFGKIIKPPEQKIFVG